MSINYFYCRIKIWLSHCRQNELFYMQCHPSLNTIIKFEILRHIIRKCVSVTSYLSWMERRNGQLDSLSFLFHLNVRRLLNHILRPESFVWHSFVTVTFRREHSAITIVQYLVDMVDEDDPIDFMDLTCFHNTVHTAQTQAAATVVAKVQCKMCWNKWREKRIAILMNANVA